MYLDRVFPLLNSSQILNTSLPTQLLVFSLNNKTNKMKRKVNKVAYKTLKKECDPPKKKPTKELWNLLCVGQLLLGMGPPSECCWYTQSVTPLEKTGFPFFWKLSIAHSLLVRDETLCLLPLFSVGIKCSLNLCWSFVGLSLCAYISFSPGVSLESWVTPDSFIPSASFW